MREAHCRFTEHNFLALGAISLPLSAQVSPLMLDAVMTIYTPPQSCTKQLTLQLEEYGNATLTE